MAIVLELFTLFCLVCCIALCWFKLHNEELQKHSVPLLPIPPLAFLSEGQWLDAFDLFFVVHCYLLCQLKLHNEHVSRHLILLFPARCWHAWAKFNDWTLSIWFSRCTTHRCASSNCRTGCFKRVSFCTSHHRASMFKQQPMTWYWRSVLLRVVSLSVPV